MSERAPRRARTRGRPPRSRDQRKADAAVALTAETLIGWGFARRAVYRVLAAHPSARERFRLVERDGLSWHRIEQVHEEWQRQAPRRIERRRYTKRWLLEQCPDKTPPAALLVEAYRAARLRPAGRMAKIHELARRLLNSDGKWLGDPRVGARGRVLSDDPELARKARRSYMDLKGRMPRIVTRK